MPQVLNSDTELAGKRLHTTDAALTNTFAGVSTITGSLRVSGQPFCQLNHSTTQSIPDTTATACTFNTESSDVGGMHDGVNPSRITIPTGQGGVYIVVGSAQFAASGTGARVLSFRVNGVDAGIRNYINSFSSGNTTLVFVTNILLLNAGDFVELFAIQTSGGALNIGSGVANERTRFSCIKLS